MDILKLKKLFSINYYTFNYKEYNRRLEIDELFNASFRNGGRQLSKKESRSVEYQIVKTYRKFQSNIGNIWGFIYSRKLERMAIKYGVDFLGNANIGDGFIIGHWGRVLINGNAKFGNEIMITHNVTIGRDVRGERAGAPTLGNRVCIRTNSTIVGNISIGDDVLIAPNTFVNFDVPSHSIVIGNPAKIYHKDKATEGHMGRLEIDE